jgi:soluble lytic murein transglycosylase-like protein
MERPTRSTAVWLLLISLSLAAASAQTFTPAAGLNRVPAQARPVPQTPGHIVPRTLKSTRARERLVVPPPKANSAFRRTFRRLMRNLDKTDRYDEIILRHAERYGLDPRLLKSVIAAESEFTRTAISPAGARGLMQLMPRTSEEFGVSRRELYDPERNVQVGAAYLDHLFSRIFKRYRLKNVPYKEAPIWVVQRVVAAYHAGPRFLYRDRFFRSTRRYVRKVLLFYQSGVTDIRRIEPTIPSLAIVPVQSSTGSFH